MEYRNEHITYVYLLRAKGGTIFSVTSESSPHDFSSIEDKVDEFDCQVLGVKVIHWGQE